MTETRLALRACRKNTFSHVAADIYAETESITTRYMINSEPTLTIIIEDGATLQYDNLTNRLDGARYGMRKFTMNRPTVLSVSDASCVDGKTADRVYIQQQKAEALRLPDDDVTRASWTFNPPDDYD